MTPESYSAKATILFDKAAINLATYFDRINYSGEADTSEQTLRQIHLAHALSIPFENLNPLLGLPIAIDIDSLQEKIINQNRGGYCFEVNTLLFHALREVGFNVKGLGGRVLWNLPPGALPARSHMLLLIELNGKAFIADTGFGGCTMPEPLEFILDTEQQTTHDVYRIVKGDEFVIEVFIQNEWKPLYQFTLQNYLHSDYEMMNYFMSTNSNSHFRHNLLMARVHLDKRFVLKNDELSIHRVGEESQKFVLRSVDEVQQVIKDVFGIAIPPAAGVEERFKEILKKATGNS
jgi:N-hydroxyarylamine O-acetyltransferase